MKQQKDRMKLNKCSVCGIQVAVIACHDYQQLLCPTCAPLKKTIDEYRSDSSQCDWKVI